MAFKQVQIEMLTVFFGNFLTLLENYSANSQVKRSIKRSIKTIGFGNILGFIGLDLEESYGLQTSPN